ncbi:MAG: ATP-binding protein [Bacteroidetes bacterium]|nr:ATP-binding protein [Bacteroidota bacterium]
MIERIHKDILIRRLTEYPNKIILVYGPRQSGKTTLVRAVLAALPGKKLEINADDIDYTDILSSRSLRKMSLLVDGVDVLFIDEAQRIPDIGINLKILHDSLPQLRIIATGSSSFDLANKTQEPLTGRTWSYHLYPIALCELAPSTTRFALDQQLDDFMIYGMYPELFSLQHPDDKIEYLRGLTQSYLYKDLLEIGAIKYARKLQDLVKLLALQIGSEVSLNELANNLQISKETVANYMDALEKAFVLFRISGFSRNLRKEITRHDKIFFYDLGVRNAVLENFNTLQLRSDRGSLWENFLILERIKTQNYFRQNANRYFWRTYTGAELDYVEEANGTVNGFEFKLSKKTPRAPQSWTENYPEATYEVINQENYLDFLLV